MPSEDKNPVLFTSLQILHAVLYLVECRSGVSQTNNFEILILRKKVIPVFSIAVDPDSVVLASFCRGPVNDKDTTMYCRLVPIALL
jgi:hypothetical protein